MASTLKIQVAFKASITNEQALQKITECELTAPTKRVSNLNWFFKLDHRGFQVIKQATVDENPVLK